MLLHYLLTHLCKVMNNKEVTLMGSQNIAVVFGPALQMPIEVLKFMLDHYVDIIFWKNDDEIMSNSNDNNNSSYNNNTNNNTNNNSNSNSNNDNSNNK